MNENALQFIGTLALLGLCMVSARAVVGHWWCSYTRQMLVLWIASGIGVAMVRMLDLTDVLAPNDARTVNGFLYLICFIVAVDINFTHFLHHRRRPAGVGHH